MRLKNAPKKFARGLPLSLDKLGDMLAALKLGPGVDYTRRSFHDDIVLTTHAEDVHLTVLEQLCKRFLEDGWELKEEKNKWLVEEARYPRTHGLGRQGDSQTELQTGNAHLGVPKRPRRTPHVPFPNDSKLQFARRSVEQAARRRTSCVGPGTTGGLRKAQ